jgi:hypothetical protein
VCAIHGPLLPRPLVVCIRFREFALGSLEMNLPSRMMMWQGGVWAAAFREAGRFFGAMALLFLESRASPRRLPGTPEPFCSEREESREGKRSVQPMKISRHAPVEKIQARGARVKPKRRTEVSSQGPFTVRSEVSGEAVLAIQVVDPRYTAQNVVDGLNAGQLTYGGGQISLAGHVVARYQLKDVDDRLVNFRIGEGNSAGPERTIARPSSHKGAGSGCPPCSSS